MNVIAARPMTVAQFLAWEERQDERYEFDGARPVAMNGGTRAHNFIVGSLYRHLFAALGSGPCRVYTAGMKVRLGDRVRYPDVMVACGQATGSDIVETAPVVVIEVLSASTASTDRTVKLAEYQASGSLRRYVMLEQVRVAATVIARGAGAAWTHEVLIGADAVLAMPEIGVTLRLGDCYEGVELPEAEGDEVTG